MLRTASCLLLLLAAPLAAQVMIGRPSVYDGDTFAFGDDVIRIYGIDAPEITQTCLVEGQPWECGQAAKLRLQELLAQGSLQCRPIDRDIYQRTIAACRAAGIDIGEALVSEGLAVALSDFSSDYVQTEAHARERGVGIWAGAFQAPADYRAENAAAEERRPRPPASSSNRVRGLTQIERQQSSVYYRNCAAARAAGASPILRGEPGYRPQLDADGDGVACEPVR